MKTKKFVIQEIVGNMWRDLFIFENLQVARGFIVGAGAPEELRLIRRVDEVIE